METIPPPVAPPPATAEDKTIAILAYITLIGFIVAIVMHTNKKTKLGSYHLRQVLGFFLTGVVVGFCAIPIAIIPILGLLAIAVVWLGMIALWVMGLIAAINGQMKPMPVVGPLYQKWFGNTFD